MWLEIYAKPVQGPWRQEGLKVPRRERKRARLGSSEGCTERLKADQVNHIWGCDFIFNKTKMDGD